MYQVFLVAQLVKNPPAVYGYTTLNAPDLFWSRKNPPAMLEIWV